MSTIKVNTIVGADGSSGLGIKGVSDGSAATSGDRGEYGITQMTSNVVINNAQATLLAYTLGRGSYMLGYHLCCGLTSSAQVRFDIQAGGVHQTYSAAYIENAASGNFTSVSRTIFLEVATSTVYTVMVDGGADSSGNVYANSGLSGNTADPDNASTFWWLRRR